MNKDRILSYQVANALSVSELEQVNGAALSVTNGCIATYCNNAMDLECDID